MARRWPWPRRRPLARLGWVLLPLLSLALLQFARAARAHDLAIDQLMLWPDRGAGELRGELTIDPELTRDKGARPDAASARRAIEFLMENLDVALDGRPAPLAFEVRELWVRGGATLGDVVRFSTPLAASVQELRVRARGFPALVVSVQRLTSAPPPGSGPAATSSATSPVETSSWLLTGADWAPTFRLDSGRQAPGWRSGGPDIFAAVSGEASAAGATGASTSDEASRALAPEGSEASGSSEASWLGPALRFVRLGFEHIVPDGVDHLLFVAGLVLARARRYRQVLVSLSLFTAAHTLTLALGNFRLVQLPSELVEPLIALSIVAVGLDNLRATRRAETRAGAPAALRHALVFGFGLVHGLGFASALSELSFGPEGLLLALFAFNLGVELGQVAVSASLLLGLLAVRRWQKLERYATLAGSAAIAAAGLFLVVDRVAGSVPPAAALVGASALASPARAASPTRPVTASVSNRASP